MNPDPPNRFEATKDGRLWDSKVFPMVAVARTPGMVRARTGQAVRVEMEQELDLDALPDCLRRFVINADAC